ncbi:MAG: c-type cytochrome [Planctomycetes bacterium]|nr:c-type cytochrome [Planctomycetota bacterium]
MSTETTRGHSYDGIHEFDNRLPNWWLWTFYLAILFSVVYWVHFHTLGTGNLPGEAYVAEQKAAAERLAAQMASNPVTEEMLLKLAKEPAFVGEGRKIFEDMTKCALCHRANGAAAVVGGVPAIGPNLTDGHWIYGGKPMDVYTTILKGRGPDAKIGSAGGMQAWESFGQDFVLKATAFVLSIKNTNVPDGKAPEPYAKKE